jgi:hypothetical protein
MSWVNTNGQKQIDRPVRVRLIDGQTRTNEEVTDELLAELGWSWEIDLAGTGDVVSTSTQATEVL